MLFSTSQMARCHNLKSLDPNLIHINGSLIERETIYRLLGVQFNVHLKWDDAINTVASSCYASLASLRRIKHLVPLNLKKQLAQSLVISKIQFCSNVIYPLTQDLERKLQKVQNSAAGFVLKKFASESDVLDIGWLPIKELMQLNILRSTHKALHNPSWPLYLPLKKHVHNRNLRSAKAPSLLVPLETGTFQDSAAKLFNSLTPSVRSNMLPKYFPILSIY